MSPLGFLPPETYAFEQQKPKTARFVGAAKKKNTSNGNISDSPTQLLKKPAMRRRFVKKMHGSMEPTGISGPTARLD